MAFVRTRPVAALAVLSLVAACAGGSTSASLDAPTSTASSAACASHASLTDQPYVANGVPAQRLDLYQPPDVGCRLVPLVVWVHGGGWSVGDKRNAMAEKVSLWEDEGWAVASLNYRLTERSAPAADRVEAPTHNQDVAAALGWLVQNASRLGIDAHRIALLGHSAGAGIVAAIAADPSYLAAVDLAPADLQCVGPLDTEGFDIAAVVAGGGTQAQLYRTVFGADESRWRELSPLTHLGDAPVPDLFLVRRGEVARRAQVDAFATAARAADANVTVVDLPAFSHEDVNRRIGDPTDHELTPALETFLSTCFSS